MRRSLVLRFGIAIGAALVVLACNSGGRGSGPDGGPAPKLLCKMNSQCWICPDDAAMKKCITNPATSGCKVASAGDCS